MTEVGGEKVSESFRDEWLRSGVAFHSTKLFPPLRSALVSPLHRSGTTGQEQTMLVGITTSLAHFNSFTSFFQCFLHLTRFYQICVWEWTDGREHVCGMRCCPWCQIHGVSRERGLGSGGTYPVKTRQRRVQISMRTWLNMAEWVLWMARWRSF